MSEPAGEPEAATVIADAPGAGRRGAQEQSGPRRWLPPEARGARLLATLGLVSDTHAPDRCPELPAALFAALSGVDLILHAGDVGALWVLDGLGEVAPVVAVHGNDDTAEARQHLPYSQTLAVAGRRLLLCHSHEPDPERERANRAGDEWAPKLERRAAAARAAGATIAVFGHTHIPLAVEHHGVLLVNPGAIASGSTVTRQRLRSAALLFVPADRPPIVVHIDLTAQPCLFRPAIDWSAGYAAALHGVSESILTPALTADVRHWATTAEPALRAAGQSLLQRAAGRVWSGELTHLDHADLVAVLETADDMPAEQRARLAELLTTRERARPGPAGQGPTGAGPA